MAPDEMRAFTVGIWPTKGMSSWDLSDSSSFWAVFSLAAWPSSSATRWRSCSFWLRMSSASKADVQALPTGRNRPPKKSPTGAKTPRTAPRVDSRGPNPRKSRVSSVIDVRISRARVNRLRLDRRESATAARPYELGLAENRTPLSASNSSRDCPDPMATQ